MQAGDTFKQNNFDLIRLVAAIQVAVYHALHHLQIGGPLWSKVTQLLPGVPVFFFVSGFLISRAWEANPSPRTYVRNRLLRIYPALWVCVIASVAMIALTGYFREHWPGVGPFAGWVLSQMTIAQFYNPIFLRDFGVGVINGSLWTICVELQFYVAAPILWAIRRRHGTSGGQATLILVALVLIFLVFNQVHLSAVGVTRDTLVWKLVGVSFLPWFYMFLIGMLAQENFPLMHRLFAGKAMLFVPLYLVLALVMHERFGLSVGNEIHPLLFIPLAMTVFSIGYTAPQAADQLLRRNDISYGIYIYHMPSVNAVLVLVGGGTAFSLCIAGAATLLAAGASWIFVEHPLIRRKRSSIHQIPERVVR